MGQQTPRKARTARTPRRLRYRVRQAFNGAWMIDKIAPKFEPSVATAFMRQTLAHHICRLLNVAQKGQP